jgi:hypothetical protein
MASFDAALAQVLGFDREELAANRQGRLTIRQRNRVFARQRSVIIGVLLITLFIGLVAGIVIIAVLTQADASIIAGILAVIGEIITVALAYFVWHLRQRYRRFLLPGYVERISGPVTCYQLKERSNDKTQIGYYVRIDALEFEVSEAALGQFQDGRPYTIYYAPQHPGLLSAERVEE